MISCSSTFASSHPATSANVTLGVSPASSFALDLPNENAFVAARLHLPEDEDPDADHHHPRQDRSAAGCRSRRAHLRPTPEPSARAGARDRGRRSAR